MELVYNWHITEKCNYSCRYCFAKWDSPREIWNNKDEVLHILECIKNSDKMPFFKTLITSSDNSSIRLNFAGGEPLMLGKSIIEIAQYAQKMGLKTSIISNGSLLLKYHEIAKYLNIIGISIDSFSLATNRKLGRSTRDGKVLSKEFLSYLIKSLRNINPNFKLKFNVVVNKNNFHESLIPELVEFKPDKIKILRQMPFKDLTGISDEMFQIFKESNICKDLNISIEDNSDMTQSYLMIDPYGRFFQNGNDKNYFFSRPIKEVGFNKAFKSVMLNVNKYKKRYNDGGK